MITQEEFDYYRIAKAIAYLRNNFRKQPSLDQVAEQVNLSRYHFQRLFKEWAGVSPKKFLQFLTLEYAKKILNENAASLFDATSEAGLSSLGRLHDLFINIEGMTPGEYKNGGKDLSINYSFAESPFGNLLVGSTIKGICYMAFADNRRQAFAAMKAMFPSAAYSQNTDMNQQKALFIFNRDWKKLDEIKLHLKGTEFQIKVWQALLRIPMGGLATYGQIAHGINKPSASRAIGSAVGSNPVSYLIPCHRVILSSGDLGQYHWGTDRKAALIGWEAARLN